MHEAALAIGMILQRFKLVDHQRYQMHLKETLTIKPDGFKIKVRPRIDKDRGAYTGRTATTAAASTATPTPRARTRPGHNTPLLVLYGSNLGTAEELATRVADLAEVNGFATKLAPLDDFVGKLPEQGGVLIFCASYNGAPPDNATQFVKWLGSDLPKDAFSKVRYAVFGCGNSDWAATYQSIPRMIDEQLAARGGKSVYARGEGDARSDLDGQFESWFAKLAPLATKEFGIVSNFTRSAEDEPLYRIEPVAPSAVNAIVNCRTRMAPTPPTGRPATSRCNCPPASPTASAIISAWCRATIRRWWIRSRAASASCPPTRSGCRWRKAGARNCRSATRCRSGGC
jgi:cytochrome P450/NADPH-cytochrome P450 reductase